MKVFLVGATGVIGRLLLPLLVEAGHEVAGSTRSSAKTADIAAAGGRPVVLNALDREDVIDALGAERPEVLINMLTDLAGLDFAANSRLRVEGSRNLVDAALTAGAQRMIAESIGWMYGAGQGPGREEEPLDLGALEPRSRAVAAVRSLEEAVAKMPAWIVLRYGILYGPGTWYARDGLTTEQVRRGEVEANDAVTSFVHVADAAQAAMQALIWPSGPVNIVDDEPARGTKWVPLYARLVGAPPPPVKHTAEPWERGASNARARGLGWRPAHPSWRDGFQSELA